MFAILFKHTVTRILRIHDLTYCKEYIHFLYKNVHKTFIQLCNIINSLKYFFN